MCAVGAGEVLQRTEAGAGRDLRNAQARLLQQAVGAAQPQDDVVLERRQPGVLLELPLQLAARQADALGDGVAFQRLFQRLLHQCDGAAHLAAVGVGVALPALQLVRAGLAGFAQQQVHGEWSESR